MCKIKKITALLMAVLMIVLIAPVYSFSASEADKVCLNQIPVTKTTRYTGNEGDSSMNVLGSSSCRNENIGVDGKVYKRGYEFWIARWNYTSEISWVKSTFKLNGKYQTFTAKTGLMKSYNVDNFNTKISFYGDGKLLKSYTITPDNYERNIKVNLTGVEKLTIYVKDQTAVAGGTSFALYNAYLSKYRVKGIEQIKSTSKSFTISWNDMKSEDGYQIYYYDSDADKYIKYKTVSKSSITIDNLTSATTYKLKIRGYHKDKKGKTVYTQFAYFQAVTKPGKTKNLKIEDRVSLTWKKVKRADGYVVYKYDVDTEKWEIFDIVTKNSCKIGKKIGSETQKYKVRAYKKSSDGKRFYGGYSNIVKR